MELNEEILAKLDNLNERMNILEKVIYEEVMKPAQEAFDRFETDERKAEFKSKYDEQLSPFNEKLKAIEGEKVGGWWGSCEEIVYICIQLTLIAFNIL